MINKTLKREYDLATKTAVINYLKKGYGFTDVSRRFNISINTIISWWRKYKLLGIIEATKSRPRKIDYDKVARYVKANPDMKLIEVGKHFGVSDTAIRIALKKVNEESAKNE